MQSVDHIFGGEAKVKIMRLFVFNPNLTFNSVEVANRTQEQPSKVRRELGILAKAGLIRRRAKGYTLDESYSHLDALENFLIDATPISDKEIVKKLSKAGHLKLVLTSGVFLHDRDSRVDILVVGDHLSQARLVSTISSIEALLGKELRYASFETIDFQYRMGIYDKLIRDILETRHEKILNKLGI